MTKSLALITESQPGVVITESQTRIVKQGKYLHVISRLIFVFVSMLSIQKIAIQMNLFWASQNS